MNEQKPQQGISEGNAVVPVTPTFSAALDEIWRLRNQLAYLAAHWKSNLAYKSYPKSLRADVEHSIALARKAARGEQVWPSDLGSSQAMEHAREQAGMRETMTRSYWEKQTFGEDT